ncbi:MAG: SDR family oxidoreductase [Patescibacteria group bacterium]|nr:SDR family oxidoreductase [Patescibacteria group bacterium]
MDSPKTILVTGALGHIGSRLIRDLPESVAKKLLLLDNLESQRYCSLFNLPEKFHYRFFQDDVRTADMDKYLQGVSAVIHLAALTNAEISSTRRTETESVNLDGLKRVADACAKHGVKLFFPSTTSVYGSQSERVDEACQELKPQSPYATSKLEAEEYLTKLGREQGLKFIICRFGTIFGASVGMRYHTAVNKFLWQAATGQPLTVWKTAWRQKRPYLDLGDCVRAVALVLKQDIFDEQTYNVLTENFTVEDIVNHIKEFAPRLAVDYVDSPIMNQLSYEVDDSKFRNLSGYRPEGELRQGIKESIDLLRGILVS